MSLSNSELKQFENVLKNLNTIFDDNYVNRKKLQNLVERRNDVKNLFVKLSNLSKQRVKVEANKNLLNLITNFHEIIRDSIDKTDLTAQLMEKIKLYVISIEKDYKILRDQVQTLEDINKKIRNKVTKQQITKIGGLLERGIKDKMPDLIQVEQKREKIEIIKEFYGFFIEYAHSVREIINENLDDLKYRRLLQDLQKNLLKKQPNDIEFYFEKLVNQENKGYSKEVLLESYCKDRTVQTYATNNSDFFAYKFIDSFAEDSFWSSRYWKKHFEYYCYIIFIFDRKNFNKFLTLLFETGPKDEMQQGKKSVLILHRTQIVKEFYNRVIEMYRQYDSDDKIVNKIEKQKIEKHKDFIIHHFHQLLKKLSNYEILFELRDNTIDKNNAMTTVDIMIKIFGERCSSIEFFYDPLNVRYCFNQPYFNLLDDMTLTNVNSVPIYSKLIFYINTYDLSKKVTYETISGIDFNTLRYYFEDRLDSRTEKDMNDLIELLRALINVGSLKLRFNTALKTLRYIERTKNEERINEVAVKIEIVKNFYGKEDIDYKILFLRLSETFNIYLIKYILTDKNEIVEKLKEFNPSFKHYIEECEKLDKPFDVDRDLIPGFSIPYYLSACEDFSFTTETIDIMTILFTVFTCDSDDDKNEFLKNKEEYKKEFKKLNESVKSFTKFYEVTATSELYQSYYNRLKMISYEHILDGFQDNYHESLKNRNDFAKHIIENFTNYKLEHVDNIIESAAKVDNIDNSIVIKTFNEMMRRGQKTLHDWVSSTRSVGDKIYFLYCYFKYSEKEFDQWFKESNPDCSPQVIAELEQNRQEIRVEFAKHSQIFEKLKITHLQHNQVGALSLIFNHLKANDKKNIFMKVGTGQGKSLIIAETVRKLFEINGSQCQVFVITCYNHLAKRDHENFSEYFKQFNMTSMHCTENTSSIDLVNTNVVYADLETYFSMLRNQTQKCLSGNASVRFSRLENAILILDEFDSLILDSDEIHQTLFKYDVADKIQNFTKEKMYEKEHVKQIFGSKFIDKCQENFNEIYDRWFEWEDYVRKNNIGGNTKQDGLGKSIRFAKSFLKKLSEEKEAQLLHIYLDPLVFFKRFKQVIGFSGSISEKGMDRFRRLFNNPSAYYEIPPFFGKINLEKNRKFLNSPGKIITNRDQFIDSVVAEIERRYRTQPVLVFAESLLREGEEKSDFDKIKEKLEKEIQLERIKDCKIYEIKSEKDIYDKLDLIGKIKTVTIATRIIGRGADIKIDKNIPDGLHLILTYYPKRRNIYVQMLGRTARQDEKGTYSEIAREGENYDDEKDIVIDEKAEILHNISEWFFKECNHKRLDDSIKWPFFFTMLFHYRNQNERNYISSNQNLFSKYCNFEKLKNFIENNIFL